MDFFCFFLKRKVSCLVILRIAFWNGWWISLLCTQIPKTSDAPRCFFCCVTVVSNYIVFFFKKYIRKKFQAIFSSFFGIEWFNENFTISINRKKVNNLVKLLFYLQKLSRSFYLSSKKDVLPYSLTLPTKTRTGTC